jgi:hypothetical protein
MVVNTKASDARARMICKHGPSASHKQFARCAAMTIMSPIRGASIRRSKRVQNQFQPSMSSRQTLGVDDGPEATGHVIA